MRKTFILLFLFFAFNACSNEDKKEKPPLEEITQRRFETLFSEGKIAKVATFGDQTVIALSKDSTAAFAFTIIKKMTFLEDLRKLRIEYPQVKYVQLYEFDTFDDYELQRMSNP